MSYYPKINDREFDLLKGITENTYEIAEGGGGGGGGITTLTGDVTAGPGSGSEVATIAANAVTTSKIADGNVTLAKQANLATDRLIGRDTAGSGAPEALTVGGGVEFTGAGGIQTSAFTGDVTKAAGGTATTIANDAVTNAKAANMANSTIKARITAGTGDPEDATVAQVSSLLQETGLVATSVGFRIVPQNSQSAAYGIVAADSGKHIFHPVGDNNARTFTIPANGSVAFPVGTAITFVNKINVVTIAITTDTLTWAQDGSTGPRSLAANGIATALKITTTEWLISGTGLT